MFDPGFTTQYPHASQSNKVPLRATDLLGLFPVNRHTTKTRGIHQMASRKRGAELRDSKSTDYTHSTGYTSSSDDDDEDYKTYYKPPSKVARKTKRQKTSEKHKFASTKKNEWSLKLTSLQFQFDTKDPSVQCVTEKEEATIKRYSESMNSHFRLGKKVLDEAEVYSHQRLRILAMEHLIQCLRQGEINDNFRKQTCGYNMGYNSTGKSSNTMESIEEPNKTNNITSPGSSEAGYSGTSVRKIFDKTTKPIDEKEVKWKVGPLIANLPGFSSQPIDPREASFLHPALTCLKPRKPSEPFLLFGVDVKCVELEHIYSLEGIDHDRPNADDVYNNSTEILSILEELYNEWCIEKSIHHNANFLETLVNAMRYHRSKSTKNDDVKKRLVELMDSTAIRVLIRLLYHWTEQDNIHMVEAHVQIFVRAILQIDGTSLENVPKKLTIFRKKATSDGCIIVPDIEYIPLPSKGAMSKIFYEEPTSKNSASCLGEITLAMFMKESNKMNNVTDVDKETETVILRPELLWQIFEQLLATIMHRELTKDKPVLFQGGLLIVGCKVRTVVLSICKEVYTKLKKCVDVTEMLDFIKTNGGSWCTIYVQRSEHTIWDIVRRAKICYNNFTEH